ncbi:uncharacterized protein LOC135384580 [Ornithodoros turicata]|uniref:uncharacterized protein LOC135384580 n=1 Tax=Ornithodoros turicata TaxID=34597 RepID=UPI003139A918
MGSIEQDSVQSPHTQPSSSRESEAREQNPQEQSEENISDPVSFLNMMKKHLAMLFLETREEYRLPRTVVRSIFGDFQVFVQLLFDFFQRHLKTVAEQNTPQDAYEKLLMFLSSDVLDVLWTTIKSDYIFMKYVKESLPYTEPQEIRLDESVTPCRLLYYMPIGKVLINMLSADDAVENTLGANCEPSNSGVLSDILDGDYARQRAILRNSDAETIVLLLYTDELELVNTLGSAAGTHKILAAYFSVISLHPKYRSRLNAIHQVMLVKYAHVKSLGIERVLDPLIKEISHLQQHGLQITVDGRTRVDKICILGIVGDNLSLNRIGGFSSSFGSGHFCRFCVTDSKYINKVTSEHNCQIRTASVHEDHIAAVEADHTKSRLYGVVARSPLLHIPDFDVTQQLLPDAMHDILEGGIAFVLKHVLMSLADSGLISASSLKVISTFKYGINDKKSKPVPLPDSFLRSNSHIKGTASQKWCILRILPQMISHLVPEGHPAWEVYLLYRHIVDIILADKVPAECIQYLQVKVDVFLQKFADVSKPEVNPKNAFPCPLSPLYVLVWATKKVLENAI